MRSTRVLPVIIAGLLISCGGSEGPTGPQGSAGTQGEQGPAGPQGHQGDPGESLNWADVIEERRLNEAIYAIGFRVSGENYLIGTGFSAHFRDVIWTNAHVVKALIKHSIVLSLLEKDPHPFVVKSGTSIGGQHTFQIKDFVVHPEYDGTTNSPDVAVLILDEAFTSVPSFLPRDYAKDLRVGQPIGTMGFPGEIEPLNTTVPIATFKDGTISALRPFSPDVTQVTPANSKFVQHNLDLSPGTSGSPIFDQQGWIIAVNNSGTESLVIDQHTGKPERIPLGNIGFGIRVDEVWDLIDAAASKLAAHNSVALTQPLLDRHYITESYMPFPLRWNGRTILP